MPDPLTGRTLVIATGHGLSLALIEDGVVSAAVHEDVVAGHAERLIPAIARMVGRGSAARCDRVVLETGPGSFTGLRVGAAAARALALAWSAGLAGVRSTLLVAAAARASGLGGGLAVALAAPRGQVWVERFAARGLRSAEGPMALEGGEAERWLAACSDTTVGSATAHGGMPDARALIHVPPVHWDAPELLYVRPEGRAAA